MFCFQFRKEFTPQLYTSLNRQGLGCSRLTHKTLNTFSEASDFMTTTLSTMNALLGGPAAGLEEGIQTERRVKR